MNIALGCYTLNYNPTMDCWWLDMRLRHKSPDDEQYVCTPFRSDMPVKRRTSMYDALPRDVYVVCDGETFYYPDKKVYTLSFDAYVIKPHSCKITAPPDLLAHEEK